MSVFLNSSCAPVPVVKLRTAWRAATQKCALALWLVFCPGFVAAVDLNTATAEQLQQIKGIGPRTAQLILEERQRGGDFDSLQNLADRVKGIGPKKIGTMEQSGLTAGASKKPAASSVAPRPGVDIRKKP